MLTNAKIAISELIIRFIQFETYFNKVDDLSLQENLSFARNKNEISDMFPLIKNFEIKYSHYCKIRFSNNYYYALKYKFDQKTKKAKFYEISYKETDNESKHFVDVSGIKMVSSCSYTLQWGIPCRHMLFVKIFAQNDELNDLPIDKRWEKDLIRKNASQENDKLIYFLKKIIDKEKTENKIAEIDYRSVSCQM